MNRKELERYIAETYNSEAENPWAKYPDNTIFRHSSNRKWFAALLTVQKEKLGLAADGVVDIVNLKCDPILAGSLRAEPGIYPAYHMNKEKWISVALDGSVPEEKIKMLLEMSFDLTAPKIKKEVFEMTDDIQKSLSIYREQLNHGYIQLAYVTLLRYVAEIKSKFPAQYHTGNVSPGYLDYTYFPFFNSYLRVHKLRFGVVLNHKEMQVELWLMGQNADVQKEYWEILKSSKWNMGRKEMPQYSVLEVVLESLIDFADKETMGENIISHSVSLALEIQEYLEKIDR